MDEIVLLNQLEHVEEVENIPDRDYWSKWHKGSPFDLLSDRQFIRLFRLSKQLTLTLIEDLDAYISPPSRVSALPKYIKVLVALKFYATGSYQTDVGTCKYIAVSQSSVSRCVAEVSNALNENEVFNKWVHFHRNIEEMDVARREFFNAFGIPGILGVIDCTHVAIYPPTGNDNPEHIYVNRKQYHSINTQLVCDVNMKILNVNARYPGSTHDAYAWSNSNLHLHMQQLNRDYPRYFLIGDSGYPLRKWLQTPIRNPEPASPEEAYNTAFCHARSIIERCNGLLKMRFRCLLRHRVLHYSPTVAAKIINACVVLHNICLSQNLPDPEVEEGDEQLDFGMMEANYLERANIAIRNADLEDGRQLQRQIIQNYFVNR